MGLFERLGRKAGRFERAVGEAAAEEYECRDCGTEFAADYDECPDCGSERVERV